MRRVVAVQQFYDMERERCVAQGDVFNVSEERFKELSTKTNKAKRILVKEVNK